jgi:hypothetical protein
MGQERRLQQLFTSARQIYMGVPAKTEAWTQCGFLPSRHCRSNVSARAAEDRLSNRRSLQRQSILKDCKLNHYVHAPAIFGVPFFARELVKVAARYGINVFYQHNLVAVDGRAKTAIFEKVDDQNKGQRVTVPFDMLHVSPPQRPADEIKSSPLVNAAGWVEVNQNSMQHVRYSNVFALGDVTSTPNSKTAAAVRKQAPVVVDNILHMIGKTALVGGYDGYSVMSADHGVRQNYPRGIHLWRQGAASSSQGIGDQNLAR